MARWSRVPAAFPGDASSGSGRAAHSSLNLEFQPSSSPVPSPGCRSLHSRAHTHTQMYITKHEPEAACAQEHEREVIAAEESRKLRLHSVWLSTTLSERLHPAQV